MKTNPDPLIPMVSMVAHMLLIIGITVLYGISVLASASSMPRPLTGQKIPLISDDLQASPMKRWQAMSVIERGQTRANYQAWLALTESERSQLRLAADRYAQLSAQAQQQLTMRFAQLDRIQQEGWRLGPRIGGYYPRLQPLLGYVRVDQQLALLGILRTMTQAELEQLAILAQRTPAQARDTLLSELIAQPISHRASWLDGQLAH